MSSSKPSRMGGLGKLSDFGKTTPSQTSFQEMPIKLSKPSDRPKNRTAKSKKRDVGSPDPLTTVNIKIKRDQHQWLSDTARQVRDNNFEPVPPSERVYPQHLIGVAIELLKNRNLDWSEIKTVEELQNQLNL